MVWPGTWVELQSGEKRLEAATNADLGGSHLFGGGGLPETNVEHWDL